MDLLSFTWRTYFEFSRRSTNKKVFPIWNVIFSNRYSPTGIKAYWFIWFSFIHLLFIYFEMKKKITEQVRITWFFWGDILTFWAWKIKSWGFCPPKDKATFSNWRSFIIKMFGGKKEKKKRKRKRKYIWEKTINICYNPQGIIKLFCDNQISSWNLLKFGRE